MISTLLDLVGLRPGIYYTLTNFRGGGQGPLGSPSIRQCKLRGKVLWDIAKFQVRYKAYKYNRSKILWNTAVI